MELDAIAAKQTPGDGDRITIKLTVEPKPYTGTAEQIEIKNEAGNGKNVEFLDMSLWRLVNDGTPDDGTLGSVGSLQNRRSRQLKRSPTVLALLTQRATLVGLILAKRA